MSSIGYSGGWHAFASRSGAGSAETRHTKDSTWKTTRGRHDIESYGHAGDFVRIGTETIYYPSGEKRTEVTWERGIPKTFRQWAKDGTTQIENSFGPNRVPTGVWKFLNHNGTIAREVTYDDLGREVGTEKRWDDSSTLRMEAEWKAGLRHGKRHFYDQSGKLTRTETWADDVFTAVRQSR